ncbi:Short chain dehydrogenase sol3 [Lasiodiplodia theobromae]|uniref:Short chain dehydrogenase sol3 n=1 Tax=Lasiodiplodia theobromae TaxID=45133 RepID=A0A5N5CWK4_9PEZI|nr:Short chain dehydrogenase sol3 [Lasiodiplodia theobromae]
MASVSYFSNFFYSQLFVTVPKPTTSFKDRIVIVTGGNIGLGLETARTIASLGAAKVVISSRSTSKGEAARADILETTKREPAAVEVWPLDLCSFDSVRAFALRAKSLPRLDALVCNAGIATNIFKLAEGHESSITTNVISTFLLSFLLFPLLKETATRTGSLSHLVIVSSEVHFFTQLAERKKDPNLPIFDILRSKENSDMQDRYNVSKLLDLLVVRELCTPPDGPASGTYPVVISAPHPGLCASTLRRDPQEGPFLARWGVYLVERALQRTSEHGARNFVICASADEKYHGQYVSDGVPRDPSPFVLSDEGKEVQKAVWEELKNILEEIEPGVTMNI